MRCPLPGPPSFREKTGCVSRDEVGARDSCNYSRHEGHGSTRIDGAGRAQSFDAILRAFGPFDLVRLACLDEDAAGLRSIAAVLHVWCCEGAGSVNGHR